MSNCVQFLLLVFNFILAADCTDHKSQGADTILCIDTSSSMEGKKFQQITEFIDSFLEGLLLVYGSFIILGNSVKHDHSFCFWILNEMCIIKHILYT